MANVKISQLSNAAALTGAEKAPVAQSGTTVAATADQIGDFARRGPVNTVASASGSVTVNLALGVVADLTLTGNVTSLAVSGAAASGRLSSFALLLRQDSTGGRTVTWPSSFRWPGGIVPTLTTTASSMTRLELVSIDGGTVWRVRELVHFPT